MSFSESNAHSSETLGEGVTTLGLQQVKMENGADRRSMANELKDCQPIAIKFYFAIQEIYVRF